MARCRLSARHIPHMAEQSADRRAKHMKDTLTMIDTSTAGDSAVTVAVSDGSSQEILADHESS